MGSKKDRKWHTIVCWETTDEPGKAEETQSTFSPSKNILLDSFSIEHREISCICLRQTDRNGWKRDGAGQGQGLA